MNYSATSVRGEGHSSRWVPNLLKDLARERLTATEVALRYRTSIDTARRWLASFHEAGFIERKPRKAEKPLGAGRPEVEHWLAKHWGGRAMKTLRTLALYARFFLHLFRTRSVSCALWLVDYERRDFI